MISKKLLRIFEILELTQIRCYMYEKKRKNKAA